MDVSDALQTAINTLKTEREFGTLYLAEGQIFGYDKDGKLKKRLELEERAWSMEVGGKNDEFLFVTTNSSFYRIRIK